MNDLIFAIDPGNTESGYALVYIPEFKLVNFGKIKNKELLSMIENMTFVDTNVDSVAIEMVGCYGMPVGKDVFDTCVWIGIFTHALSDENVNYIYRRDEKMHLCGDMRAKDSNIRQALINRYAKHDFKQGKGTKKNPDVFYGVSKDVWQAIAVAITHWEISQGIK